MKAVTLLILFIRGRFSALTARAGVCVYVPLREAFHFLRPIIFMTIFLCKEIGKVLT